MIATSFTFTEEFKKRLDELAQKFGKSRTSLVVDAVNAYASGILPDRGLMERLDQLAKNDDEIRKEIDELKTLITQVLKNQQRN